MRTRSLCLIVVFTVILLLNGLISSSFAFRLPDTGQTKCYNSSGTEISCSDTGQDGEYSINPMSFTNNSDGTVTDNNTGLMWQNEDDGITRTWSDAGAYCDDLITGDYSDWRLPTKRELVSIINYGTPPPAISAAYFPSARANIYWTATTSASDSSLGWNVNFYDYSISDNKYWSDKSNMYFVRCVRGQRYPLQNLVNNNDGTITDTTTGLTWQQSYGGQRSWGASFDYCSDLNLGNFADWRLPNAKELESISDDLRFSPAINTNFFLPNASYAWSYWSSTTWLLGGNSGALGWRDVTGAIEAYDKSNIWGTYVRCVRGGDIAVQPPILEAQLEISPLTYDFGNVAIHTCSTPQPFTVTNTGGANLTIYSITLSTAALFDPPSYILEGTGNVFTDCPLDSPFAKILPPGDSCTFAVRYCPTTVGSHDAYVTISSTDADGFGGYLPLTGRTLYTYPVEGISYSSCPVDTGTPYDSSNPNTWFTMVWTGRYSGDALNRCEGTGGHPGVDIIPRTAESRNIKAIGYGTVIEKRYLKGFGNYVIIEHTGDPIWRTIYSAYLHLASFDPSVVRGGTVEKGQQIGIMGNTGGNWGVHLHFQIDKTPHAVFDRGGNVLYYKPYWTTFTAKNGRIVSYPAGNDASLTIDQLQEAAQNVMSNTINPIEIIEGGAWQ